MVKKALILAAGLGSRLLKQTEEKPKALVEINGKPILEYQLESLGKNGIKEVVIVIGYKGEKIKEFLKNKFKNLNIKFIENKNYASSNSSYSFWLAKDEIKNEPYIHLNCDIVFFADLIKKLIDSKYDNVIFIDRKVPHGKKREYVLLEGDKIIEMNRDVVNPIGQGTGIAKFSPENIKWLIEKIQKYIEDGDKNQTFYNFIREGIYFKNFYGLDSEDSFIKETNTLEELEEINKLLKR